jgi:hypothetical protein
MLYTTRAVSRRKIRFRAELDDEGALVLPAVCKVLCKSAMVESLLTRRPLRMIGLIPSRTALSR